MTYSTTPPGIESKRGDAYSPEYDPYLRLLEAMFAGAYGNNAMTIAERISWMETYMPRTWALISATRTWDALSDI